MQDYFGPRQKIQHPLHQVNKPLEPDLFPAGESQGLVLTGVGPASCPMTEEACVMQREQLRKQFSGDRQSQPSLSQQLEQ